MGLFGSMASAFTDLGSDTVHLGNSAASGLRMAGHEAWHTTQQLEGPIKNVVTEAGEDVGKVGSEASEETASGLEAAGVPDGVAEAAGLGAEVMADGAIAAA